jgi:hypothetical protein
MQQTSLLKIPNNIFFKNFLNVHTTVIHQETVGQYYYSLFLHISLQLIENNTETSMQQENKNLLRKRQTSRPRLKPESEHEVHMSFSCRLRRRVVFCKSIYSR